MSRYQKRKEAARQKAIDWQMSFSDSDYSYSEIAVAQSEFEHLAKRYGLVEEFRNNGII